MVRKKDPAPPSRRVTIRRRGRVVLWSVSVTEAALMLHSETKDANEKGYTLPPDERLIQDTAVGIDRALEVLERGGKADEGLPLGVDGREVFRVYPPDTKPRDLASKGKA